MYNINNKNCNIAKGRTSTSKICERLMPWSINNKETWKSEINRNKIFHSINMTLNIFRWEEGSTNLLGNTTSFSGLDTCFSKFIENQSFSGIDVTHNTNDWASKFSGCVFILFVFSSSNFSHGFGSSGSSFCFGIVIVVASGKNINSCGFFFFFILDCWFFILSIFLLINLLFCFFYSFG